MLGFHNLIINEKTTDLLLQFHNLKTKYVKGNVIQNPFSSSLLVVIINSSWNLESWHLDHHHQQRWRKKKWKEDFNAWQICFHNFMIQDFIFIIYKSANMNWITSGSRCQAWRITSGPPGPHKAMPDYIFPIISKKL